MNRVSPTALSPRAHNSTPVQRESFRHRARLSDTIRDVLVTMCFFGDAEIPVQLLCGLADSAILSEALDALVACMSIRSILSVSHIKMDSSLRKRMRLEVSALPDGPEYLDFVLNALSSELPAAFTQKDALQVGHNINAHILSTLRAAMGISVERDVCQKAAYLAVRVTGYLHAAGQYAIAVGFMATFRRWCQQQFPTEFQMLTGMREKECTALRLQGDSHNALRFARDIYHTRRQAYGKDDEKTLCSLNSKGLIYYDLGNNSSASRCLHTAYESNAGLFGETHANTLVSANNLGLVYQSQGYHEDASDMFRRSLTHSKE
jgi:tetratricopeptide (TPR) repeat protein